MAEFFHMGGYGLYVWGSYGLAAIVLLLNLLLPWARHRMLLQRLRRSAGGSR